MKNTITMNNALKYYYTNDLCQNSELREKLSQDFNAAAYSKMLEKIRNRYFLCR